MKEFSDNSIRLSKFEDHRIVHCPKCAKPTDLHKLKLTCVHCGFNKVYELGKNLHYTSNTLPLEEYLVANCGENMLWAYNLRHLEFIESYVSADLRKRIPNTNNSLASRLPKWIKSKKNRNDILKAVRILKKKLIADGYRDKEAFSED